MKLVNVFMCRTIENRDVVKMNGPSLEQVYRNISLIILKVLPLSALTNRRPIFTITGPRSACHSAESLLLMNIIAWGPQVILYYYLLLNTFSLITQRKIGGTTTKDPRAKDRPKAEVGGLRRFDAQTIILASQRS